MGACTMLNSRGDTTIAWTPDRDDDIEAVIAKKMTEGVTFFMIDPRFGHREKLTHAADALRHRVLAIPDEDFAAFVGAGKGDLVPTPAKVAKTRGRAKTAKEVAKGESVAVQQRRGG